MFGSSRRKGKKQYTPPTAASVNPSAATAAVSAYNLSSAAAAAALKALPTPPTNVAAVQTKRTMRRSASVSSEGSRRPLSPVPSIKRAIGLGGNKDTREGIVVSPTGAPTLRRRGSSSSIRSMSSMAERTFRSPSPHNPRAAALAAASASPNGSISTNRSLSMNAAGTAAALAAGRSTGAAGGGGGITNRSRSMPPPPPVPVIPKHVVDSQPKQQKTKQTQGKRASTLGFVQQPLRLASEKQKQTRSSWFGSAAVGNIDDVRTSDLPMDINGYAQQPERPGSCSSLQNFSYPSRQRLGSPPSSPTLTKASTVAPAAGAASAVSLPPVKNLTRSASTERVPQQPASQPKAAAAPARRSASTSRVIGRSNAGPPDMTLVYDPNSRRMVPRAELLMLEQSILDSAERPQKQQRKKKQQQGATTAYLAGTHLSQGTMTHAHGSAAPLNRAEVQRAVQEPRPQRVVQQQQLAPLEAPQAPRSPPPERQLPKISTAVAESQKPVQTVEENGLEEPPQPLPALSTSASTPSSSVSSLTALAASQMTTSPVTIQSVSAPEDGGFEGTLLTEDGRPVLAKRPSTVREEPDLEEEKEKPHNLQNTTQAQQQQPELAASAAVVAAASSRTARDGLDGVSPKHIHHRHTQPASQQDQQLPTVAAKEQDQERTRSNSPLHTAHFSPIVGSNLTVRRHSPPPRSISPRKSALKQPNNRDASPSDSASEANHVSDFALHNRKKAHRVSFDDKAVIVSQSPLPPSPPHSPGLSSLPGASEAPQNSHTAHQPPSRSRSWFSNIGRTKKKTDHGPTGADDDEVMKPRPALPSFGSVRDKSHPSQPEERPLVRPASESQPTRQASHPPATGSSAPLESHSTSSDHAIGFIVGAERQISPQGARNTPNTSRYREPLPPVVTSVDGSGYVSDSGDSSNDDEANFVEEEEHSPILRFDEEQETTVPTTLDEPILPSAPAAAEADQIIVVPGPSSPDKSPKKTVPAIAISHPSQENLTAVRGTEDDGDDEGDDTFEEPTAVPMVAVCPPKSSPVRSLFDVPGTFPMDSESDGTAKSSPTHATFATANQPVPTRQDTFEPIVQDDDHSYSPQMPATVFATHMPTLHEETSLRNEKLDDDDSDSEVFSDAYEDLSDFEGDGFLSLDAVVDSPIVPDISRSPFATSPITGSPSHKSEVLQLGPSPLAKEVAPSALAADTNGASATTVAVAAGGVAVGMAALATAAAGKQINGVPTANPGDEEDWDKIKAFWRGLTTEKRAQLEKEAREEAAVEGDLDDETATADKKPRRKKSVETRIAEKKAIQELAPVRQEASPPIKSQTEKPTATRIRRSMRDNNNAVAAGSGALPPPHPSTIQKERPASAFPPKAAVGAVTGFAPKMHSRTMSADSSASSAQGKSGVASLIPSALRRRGSDSSESSFKRFRSNSNGAASGAAAGAANFRTSMRGDAKATATSTDSLNHRNSRFSLRSLSPTGSTTLRGSTESSPAQFRKSMRDGTGSSGFASSEMKRNSSSPMATSTLRKGAAADSGSGFFSSLSKKRGSKLLQRSNGGGKSGRSRFDSSDEEDEDIFGPSRATNGSAAARRSASAGGAYTFRSRFVDSSDEDDVVPNNRTVDARKNGKEHVVPKTLRGGSTMHSASARPASASTPKSPPLPEELEEEEEEAAMAAVAAAGQSAGASIADKNNLGTSTLRRSRSGRGQIAPVSPMYSPTTTGAVGVNSSSMTPTRRSSGIMSVLRRKKNDGPASPTSLSNGASGNKIQRPGLVDSAARRDTQLERNSRELAAVRSNSRGSQGRRAAANGANDDSDDDDHGAWPLPDPSINGQTLQTYVSAGDVSVRLSVSEVSPEQRKKKFPGLRRMFRLDD